MGNIFEWITREFMVIFIAALPLIEVRGAIPIGVSLGMNPIHAGLLGVLGSMLPVPFLLLFLEPIFRWLKSRSLFQKFIHKIVHRTLKKSDSIRKYKLLGLLIFVAIPLPGTGVWAGSLAATLFSIRPREAFVAIGLGNIIASSIMLFLSYIVIVG